jgi:hypothetical protein
LPAYIRAYKARPRLAKCGWSKECRSRDNIKVGGAAGLGEWNPGTTEGSGAYRPVMRHLLINNILLDKLAFYVIKFIIMRVISKRIIKILLLTVLVIFCLMGTIGLYLTPYASYFYLYAFYGIIFFVPFAVIISITFTLYSIYKKKSSIFVFYFFQQ